MNVQENKTILLVEDEILIAMVQAQSIRNFAYDVIIAGNGEKAVKIALNNEKIDLILMDIDLGKGLDGPQAAQKILEKRNIPIVFLTSHSEKEYVNRVKEITHYGYVIKNSGDFVLQSSIEMAFELFDANQKLQKELEEHKRTETQLRENKARLMEAQRIAHIGNWELDLLTNTLVWSDEIFRIFEIDKERFGESYEAFLNAIHPDDLNVVNNAYTDSLKSHKPYGITHRLLMSDGRIKYVHEQCENYYDSENKPIASVGTVQDITENRKAEDVLRESEERFRSIYNMEPECVKILNPDCTLVAMNPAGLSMIEADSFEMVKGQSVLPIIDEKFRDDFRRITDNVCQKGESAKLEFMITGIKGTPRWLETHAVPIRNLQKEITGLLSVTRDITEHKLAEEKIKHLLHEKDLILKEVHHRIKNNMNTMSSLLHLQSNAQDNLATKNILQDAAGRIRSMMVLYDKLYRSDNIKAISVKEYFSGLIIDIVSLFPKKGEVEIKTQIDDIILGADILSCLGIIINELITNSMKYAFLGHDNSRIISITVSEKGNCISIIFEDNGTGIPESVSIENSTGFGLKLIGILVEQINGTIKLDGKNRKRFIIEFEP